MTASDARLPSQATNKEFKYQASTPPASWYTGAAAAAERSLFRNNWQLLAEGLAAGVEAPGSYIAAECSGVPVLVARGTDGRLRAFYNVRAPALCPRPACQRSVRRLLLLGVAQAAPHSQPKRRAAAVQVCRHHAAAVAQGTGTAQNFTCPYHGSALAPYPTSATPSAYILCQPSHVRRCMHQPGRTCDSHPSLLSRLLLCVCLSSKLVNRAQVKAVPVYTSWWYSITPLLQPRCCVSCLQASQ